MSNFRIRLFSLFGFPLSLDISLFILAALLILNLGSAYFPAEAPGISRLAAYGYGALGAFLLFVSIVFHELAHALVARRYDLPVGGITLFIFGGVAELRGEPKTAKAEFWVAIAGPIASFILAFAFALIAKGVASLGSPALTALVNYAAVINAVLAIFNLLPAFPLDGGRVLRALLWWRNGDIVRATQIATSLGTVLAFAIMGLGIYNALSGNVVGGMWYVLIGFFINNAAAQSRAHTEITSTLRGVPVSEIMKPGVVSIPSDAPLAAAANDYFNRYLRKTMPVTGADGRLLGTLRLKSLSRVPKTRWAETRAVDVMEPLDARKQIVLTDDAFEALVRMHDLYTSELYAVSDGKLEGTLSRRDLLDYHNIQMELRAQSRGGAQTSL